MAAALTLPFGAESQTNRRETAYRLWRRQHPESYEMIKQEALRAASERAKIGVKAIVEWCRWETCRHLHRANGIKYRFNNNYTSLIARDLVRECPELYGKIELRGLRD